MITIGDFSISYKVLIYCVFFLFSFCCNILTTIKKRKLGIQLTDEETKKLLSSKLVPMAIISAECAGFTAGTEKKLYCESVLICLCSQYDINFDDYRTYIDEAIESLIELSNKVNVKGK